MGYYTAIDWTSVALSLSLYNSFALNHFIFSFLNSFDLLGENPNDRETFIPQNCREVVCYLSCLH